MSAGLNQGFDIPYVCNLYQYYRLCETLPLFTFHHPCHTSHNGNGDSNSNSNSNGNSNYYNNRVTTLKFKRENFFIGNHHHYHHHHRHHHHNYHNYYYHH